VTGIWFEGYKSEVGLRMMDGPMMGMIIIAIIKLMIIYVIITLN